MTSEEYILLKRAHRILMLGSFKRYVSEMYKIRHKSNFIFARHHDIICEELERVISGDTRKLIINIAPRYGKTELAVKMFISYGFAINPASKFLHLSYSGALTQDNSVEIKDIVTSEYYQTLFETRIRYGIDTKMRWNTVQGGGMYATSTLGQITGFGAGITDSQIEEEMDDYMAEFNPNRFGGAIIIDDPIKPEDALSDVEREKVNRRFETTIRNRVNSRNTPIVIIMQRLHLHDLCGYLNEVEPNEWRVISLPSIYLDEDGNEQALWPQKHSLDELHKLYAINPFVFESQHLQNPQPIEGLMFPQKDTVYFDIIPDDPDLCFIQVDPADEGGDNYCSKVFYVKDRFVYNVDVLYSTESIEYVMPRQLEQIMKWKPSYINIESNSAWRLVAKELKEKVMELELATEVRRFVVHTNKEIRIFNEAPAIRNYFQYLSPKLQNKDYKTCMYDRHNYMKNVKNQKDDGVDVDAAACFFLKKNGFIDII